MLVLNGEQIDNLVEVLASRLARQAPQEWEYESPSGGNEPAQSWDRIQQGLSLTRADVAAVPLSEDVRKLAGLIDHTLLRPEATRDQIERTCDEARSLGCAAVCVNPTWVPLAAQKVRGSQVRVATVAGFPLGASSTPAKRAEAQAAILAGAREIDMVLNIGAMRSGDLGRVESDIRGVVEVCHPAGAIVKVILENAFLSDGEKVAACQIAQRAGADFVKTSTGFAASGATPADVRLMRETVGSEMGVKAAGGIRTLAGALKMLAAGANRLGTSASASILAEAVRLPR